MHEVDMTKCLVLSMQQWRQQHEPQVPRVERVHLQVGAFTCVEPDQLITTGAYRWLRHPIYLAFLLLLLASGLLISAGTNLILSTALYLFGSELRIALEESELTARFPTAYPQYCKQTRWRYLPGLR